MAVFHGFYENVGVEMKIPIPKGYQIKDVYSYEEESVAIADDVLCVTATEDMKAVAVYLEK